ncbi:MAG: F(420)H(2) dehydrogenase subunit H [Candidatus Bathyarchaeota archaeon BA1]|nr:MAG: F(420)H(2) dehydrogenase subunit H [Candidatus Bathyarchaeota archaeon BA1]
MVIDISAALLVAFSFPMIFFFSLLFEGIDRKLHARMQKRIGPPIIQPFYDFVKLFNKERIVPMTAASGIFTTITFIAAVCSILGAAIPLITVVIQTSIIGDLILILYLLAMPSLMMMVGGSSSGNPYGAIGFSRMMTMVIAYEVPLLTSIILISLKSGFSLTCYTIILAQVEMKSCFAFTYPSMAFAAATFLLCIPAGAGVVPFDIPEAKTEVIHGPFIEYGGPYLALMKLAKSALTFALIFLASTLFFFVPALLGSPISSEVWASLGVCLLVALIVMICTVTVPRTIFARLKIGQAFKFYWLIPLVLAILSVAFFLVGM